MDHGTMQIPYNKPFEFVELKEIARRIQNIYHRGTHFTQYTYIIEGNVKFNIQQFARVIDVKGFIRSWTPLKVNSVANIIREVRIRMLSKYSVD